MLNNDKIINKNSFIVIEIKHVPYAKILHRRMEFFLKIH